MSDRGRDNSWDHYWDGYGDGAAVAFGIIGMAESIRARHETWQCAGCGVYGTSQVVSQGGLCWCPWPRVYTRE